MVLVRVYYGSTMQGQLKVISLAREYIAHGAIKHAAGLLKMLDWNTEGNTCLSCLHAVLNHLFRQPLDSHAAGINVVFFYRLAIIDNSLLLPWQRILVSRI